MSRTARLFLLQRLKGNLSGEARYFNNIETRAVIKFFFLQGKAVTEIEAILTEILEEYASSYATVKNCVAQFKRGDFSTCVVTCPGRPKTVTIP
jgi:transposase